MSVANKDLQKLYFIYDADSNDSIEISLDILPDTVNYSYTPGFEEQSLLGRLSPIFMYKSGSAKTYSFSIKIHQDLINEDFITFVDKIKMLSYPKKKVDNTLGLPKVYFQLGELAGYCIVQTSISWEKPYAITNGHYAMATIQFTLTVEREIVSSEINIIEIENKAEIVYSSLTQSGLNFDQASNIAELLTAQGYDFSISDLVVMNSEIVAAQKELAEQNYDYQIQRLQNVFTAFSKANAGELLGDIDIIRALKDSNYDYQELTTSDDSESEIIKKAKDQFESFLDDYYDQNKTMTREEYNLIFDEVYTILENLQTIAEEIGGYAASN